MCSINASNIASGGSSVSDGLRRRRLDRKSELVKKSTPFSKTEGSDRASSCTDNDESAALLLKKTVMRASRSLSPSKRLNTDEEEQGVQKERGGGGQDGSRSSSSCWKMRQERQPEEGAKMTKLVKRTPSEAVDDGEGEEPSKSTASLKPLKRDQRGRPLHDLEHSEYRPSLLSHHVKSQNLKGFYNLFVIVLLVTNARLVVENIMKYGVMIEIPRGPQDILKNWPLLACFITMHLFVFSAWIVERYVAGWGPYPSNLWVMGLQLWNYGMVLIVPYLTVSQFDASPLGAVLLLSFSVVWCFKFLSFHHVCFDVRRALNRGENLEDVCSNKQEAAKARAYPESITFQHFYRFILMPTMCFQFHYPTTPSIRWVSIGRHAVESLVLLSLAKIIIEQYIFITVKNTFSISALQSIPLSKLVGHLTERVLKLSVPNLYVWLLMFMALFHHWCNILAELTQFGDRHFYDDWWNASSFGEYWRKWNLPVHHFLNRHVHKPLLRKGVPKVLAGLAVFAISALLHEYMVVVPLHLNWTGWVFWAFLVQLPFVYITENKFFQTHKTVGNVVFWIAFCFSGQPIGVLLYFYLWGVKFGHVQELDPSRIKIA